MTERLLAYSSAIFLSIAPVYSYANAFNFADLRFSYAQSTILNGSNYVKVAFNRLATNAAGSLASAGQYVSYIRPTATMIARTVIPRLLLAASGVGTAALVGYGIYELWQYMQSKGYTFDSLTNSINFGGSNVADITSTDKLNSNFLNDVNSYYSGGFSSFAYGQSGSNATIFNSTNALSVCNQFLNSASNYNSYFKASNCVFTGEVNYLNSQTHQVLFNYTLIDTCCTSSKPETHRGFLNAHVSKNTYPVREDAKPTSVSSSVLADHIVSNEDLPTSLPSFANDFAIHNPQAYNDVIQSVFNPAFPESAQNIEDAKSEARPAYAGEVADTAPAGSVVATDQVIPLPQTEVTTKNPDGTISQYLPTFCSWAPSVCQAADSFLATTNPQNEKVPELKPEITVSDRLNVVAQCPAPYSFNVLGQNFDIKYDSVCSFAEKIRPLVLTAGYIGSAFLVLRRA